MRPEFAACESARSLCRLPRPPPQSTPCSQSAGREHPLPARPGRFRPLPRFPRVVPAPVSPWPDAICGASPKRFCSCPSPKPAAVLLAGDLPHGPEPDRQGQMTVLKYGPRRNRHLIPALVAAPALPPNRPSLCSGAARTDPSARPAQSCEILGAGLLPVETPFQLQQCPRVILAHSPGHYILGQVAIAVGIPVARHPPHRTVRALISAYGSYLG